nr:hypothetical protein [Streptomyces sp. MNP-20]
MPADVGSGGFGAAGVYDVAVFVRKFQRHSSQNGAFASRGVRHWGHSWGSRSGTADRCGRLPGAGGGPGCPGPGRPPGPGGG